MLSNTYQFAPPAKTVDGLLAVPIDIQNIEASLQFDALSESAEGDARVQFTSGTVDGYPIFDLRQTIQEAWLDGINIDPSHLNWHDFSGGSDAKLRVVESHLSAKTDHELRVRYHLDTPQASTVGSYPPELSWHAGPRLVFNYGFTDLGAGRYLEAWIPANLVYDQFRLSIDVEIHNTSIPHSLITNGTVTVLAINHWQVTFPDRFTALSPLIEIRASDTVTKLTDSVLLPVSGTSVEIEAWKLLTSSIDLETQINYIKSYLSNNENQVGRYIHGTRYVAFLHQGGMEYDGATTTSPSALRHECFHSWWGRGVKPASQVDGWWDEAWTKYYDVGAATAVPFDFASTPTELSERNPWSRITPSNAYNDGRRFFEGLASMLGIGSLKFLMNNLYQEFAGQLMSTEMIEAYLLSQTGNENVVDAFHRFVYGFPDILPLPELWMKDDVPHTGSQEWGGNFWNSPDMWVRNQNDDGLTHQNPEYGQDNWIYARVRNQSTTQVAHHFMVVFNAKSFAGVEFIYPGDYFPAISAAPGFDLAPRESRIVKTRWPRQLVPPPGTHPCLLGAVIARDDHPQVGTYVWEHNNLCQKNLTIVDLKPNAWIVIPFVLNNFERENFPFYALEVRRPTEYPNIESHLMHPRPEISHKRVISSRKLKKSFPNRVTDQHYSNLLDCGGNAEIDEHNTLPWTSENPGAIVAEHFENAKYSLFSNGKTAKLSLAIPRNVPLYLGWRIQIPKDMKPGTVIQMDLVKRQWCWGKILGGISVQIQVKKE